MKSFKVKSNRSKMEKNFKKFIASEVKRDEWKKDAAELAINNIKIETRLQRYIKTGEGQPAISSEWANRKKKLAKYNQKGKSYSPSKSNLTLTGQLLESLKWIPHKTRVIIEPTGMHSPYKTKNGTTGKPIENKKLAGYLAEKGRFFVGYNDKLRKAVTKKFKEHLRRRLQTLNK